MNVAEFLDEVRTFAPQFKTMVEAASTLIPQLATAQEIGADVVDAWTGLKTAHEAFAAVVQQHAPPTT